MKKDTGFTLMELVTVIVILGILSAAAVPVYQDTLERGRANEAVVNLSTIYMANKIYFTDHNAYYIGSGTVDINAALGTNLESSYYDISITGDGVTYLANAQRNGTAGGDSSQSITIDNNGCFGGSSGNNNIPPNTRPGC